MELVVYKASAGSGKTFTLTIEYIKKLIADPKSYRHILAVTFTNKATTEMKERILSQLYGIWQNDKDSISYLNILIETTGNSAEVVRQRAGEALHLMLHDYDHFRVETIDSFFQSVMRNLARELELSPNLNIELKNVEVLSDAVDSLIEKLDATSQVLAWLLDYIYERIADDKRWNVAGEIKGFGRNIFNEGYIEQGEQLREKLRNNPNLIKEYSKHLKDIEKEALEQMKGFYEKFIEEIEAHQLTIDDFKNKSRGIPSYFNKLKNGELDEETRNKTVEACLESSQNWVTKTAANYSTVIALVEDTLMEVLQQAEQFRAKNNMIINSCELSLQHLNKVRLLTHIDEEVRTLNYEHNRFLLSDTNALLHNLMKEGDSSFIFEKIGSNIRHVMIDEFQDTSRMQWDNFRLLLLEGLSHGADSLIVGDVKQSIYRWRNGDWGILNGLNDQIDHFPIRQQTLNTNWRSEARIIRFNNEVFDAAIDFLNTIYKDELKEDCEPLQKAYSDVMQLTNKKVEKGYIKASFIAKDEEHNYAEKTLIELGEEVMRLLNEGVHLNDITILVRKNKAIPDIADYFDKELKLKVVSNEAFRLDASASICMMIDAVAYLADNENKIALLSLLTNYQQLVIGFDGDIDTLFRSTPEEYLPRIFTNEGDRLRMMPLYELLEELFRIFDLHHIPRQDAYLFAFFDAVTEYLQSNSSDLDTFLKHWEESLSGKTIPTGEVNGIQIMSIHKSKGLEFHTVLIPYCDWTLESEANMQLVWCSPQEAPYKELDLVPMYYSNRMANSIYRKDYEEERLQLWVDNLNILYVAFTRAAKNLILWTEANKSKSMSQLLSNVLPIVAQRIDADMDVDGTFEWGELMTSEVRGEKQVTNKLAIKPSGKTIQMLSLAHEIEFKQSNKSADFIKGLDPEESDDRFINRGQLLHTLFSNIRTKTDIDKAIDRLIFEGVIDSGSMAEEVRQLTEQAFSMPQVDQWYSEHWRLFNECAIIYKEKGILQTKRPDRVMMDKDHTIVVDFKFGKPHKKYAKQVKEYMTLLADMKYEHISGYIWYVDESKIEAVLS